ncbi:MAG TPA: DUF494 domain-containing protein [Gammaproteobacteria bacterium]|nr:DUF494 domain-containing protein [Gammaproteobacteria bacterium]
MKESVLDVLIYLFDNYMDGTDDQTEPDREELTLELEEAGFRDGEIAKAFDWLEELAMYQRASEGVEPYVTQSVRVFSEQERARLDPDCRGFLMYLEQIGILTPVHREIVIDRIMALDSDEIDLDQVKWVALMVLFNLPGQEAAYAWMEDLVFDNQVGLFH